MENPGSKRRLYRPVNSPTAPRYSGIRTFMRLPYVTDLEGRRFCHRRRAVRYRGHLSGGLSLCSFGYSGRIVPAKAV